MHTDKKTEKVIKTSELGSGMISSLTNTPHVYNALALPAKSTVRDDRLIDGAFDDLFTGLINEVSGNARVAGTSNHMFSVNKAELDLKRTQIK